MKDLFQKHRKASLFCLFFFFILFLIFLFTQIQALQFRHFTQKLFREEMQNDTLSMHYTIANPQTYGIPTDQVCLLPYSKTAAKQQEQYAASCSDTLASIHPLFWKKQSRLLLTLLQEKFSLQQKSSAFSYYGEPLSPGSGIPANLPILLAEYTFRSEQDVKNYLTLLSQIPPYLEGIADYEREKSAAGLFMSEAAAEKVIQQCYQIMDFQKLKQDTHFLNTTFSDRLLPLVEKQLLTEEKAIWYEKRNHQLLLEQLMPAYESLGDAIFALKGTGKNDMGLAHLPEGPSYYALLLKESTGCYRSIAHIKALLTDQLQKDSETLSALLAASPHLLSLPLDSIFPQMSPEACLTDLQKRMADEFPDFPETSHTPAYTIKAVSKSLEEYCSPAFYLTPPMDDISENSIYINEKNDPDALELYTTLAHEGYPGHLYQTVYHQLCQQKNQSDPARSLLHWGGYSEGWALYVEMHAYDYAKELLQEQNASPDALQLVEVLRLNRSVQLCMYSLLDLAIHYEGATPEMIQKDLKKLGITDPDLISDIYEYIVEEPANYPKYYLGYLEFEMLKEAAQKKWGSTYRDLRFHKLVLETGPCPFPILWKLLA